MHIQIKIILFQMFLQTQKFITIMESSVLENVHQIQYQYIIHHLLVLIVLLYV
jgi:hypothetical protein